MILWQQQASAPLAEALETLARHPELLHPDEILASDGKARPGPSLAVRGLAKPLLVEALAGQGIELAACQISILPFNAPPEVRLPLALPPGLALHISLSHSGQRVLCLVVLEGRD
ncbi:MAG: hypothetical protein KDC10_03675 [Calditrichaeota bacterium]|nr:hypothetical protein [Calditrichota bacterium]